MSPILTATEKCKWNVSHEMCKLVKSMRGDLITGKSIK